MRGYQVPDLPAPPRPRAPVSRPAQAHRPRRRRGVTAQKVATTPFAMPGVFGSLSCRPRAKIPGIMYVNIDPEGNVSGIFPDSPLSLVIPAGYNVHLFGSFDSSWEQAIVIYIY